MASSRLSRQASPADPQPNNDNSNQSPTSANPSLTNNIADTSHPSSTSPPRMSKDSEGYPSWLPKRPPPPAPASTMHSSVGVPDLDPDTDPELFASIGGRKPTPRSVRIVSLQGVNPLGRVRFGRQGRDNSRPGLPTRAWSRGTAPSAPTAPDEQGAYTYTYPTSTRIPQPKFNAKNLDLKTPMVTPSTLARLYYLIFPILAFAHLPLQTYFDFNAVYILIQVSKNPNPEAPGVPGSGRNWALAAAAYVACWLAWIFCVFLLYELVYSFIRRWRIKRPLMMPIYLSSPANTFVSMTSYTNFRFFLYLRLQAWFGDNGGVRDGLAETFYWYSQNLPTVALLIPRAGLCLALLFAFSTPQIGTLSLASMGINHRDPTFFRRDDGTLTGYARGVLIANATWAAWRILVLLVSWIGLWILSGQGCAGLCGPRYRWEEEEAEKTRSTIYSTENDSNRDIDALAWTWKECTRLRIQDSYELCLNTPGLRWGSSASPGPGWKQEKGKEVVEPDPVDVQRVLAAVGIPSVPAPARRRVLTEDFFESPKDDKEIELRHRDSDKGVGPSTLPYPFTQQGSAQVSSRDKVPFPPSPSKSKQASSKSATTHTSSGATSSSTSTETSSGDTENDSEEEEEEEEEEDEFEGSGSAGHGSNSMSSLGHPITPSRRHPLGFRHPGGRGNSTSSRSHQSRPSQSGVSQSGISYSGISQSTGNVPSSDSPSDATSSSSSRPRASLSQSSATSGIPMPPRHPNPQTRTRLPSTLLPSLPGATAVEFPSIRIRVDSGILPGVTTVGDELMQDDAESLSGSDSASDEHQDEVGLLSPGASHTNLGVPELGGPGSASSRSRTGSSARSRTSSARSQPSIPAIRSRVSSLGVAVRSRAQSMLQSVSATSLDVVRGATRSRTNSSMARLEEEVTHNRPELPSAARTRDVSGSTQESQISYPYSYSNPQAWEDIGYASSSSHSRSGSGSGGENWTFGQPMPFMRPGRSHLREEVHTDSEPESPERELRDVRQDTDVEEITREFGPARTPQIVHPQSLIGPGMPGARPMSASIETTSSTPNVYHSEEPSTRTASPLPPRTPHEGDIDSDAGPSISVSPAIDIPWGRSRLREHSTLHERRTPHDHWPEAERSVSSSPPQAGLGQASISTSRPDISTAAQSFVTAPLTVEGTVTTESLSEGRTEQGSLNESSWNAATSRAMRGAGIGNVGLGPGGMGPERGDTMGDWRVR